jgi:hypothetical protein
MFIVVVCLFVVQGSNSEPHVCEANSQPLPSRTSLLEGKENFLLELSLFASFLVLEFELRASHLLGRCSTT